MSGAGQREERCPEKCFGGDGSSAACGPGAGDSSRAQDCPETDTLLLEVRGGRQLSGLSIFLMSNMVGLQVPP